MSNTSCIDVLFFLFDYISFIPDFFMNFFVASVFYGTYCMIKKVYGSLELIVNICVLGKMRIAALISI